MQSRQCKPSEVFFGSSFPEVLTQAYRESFAYLLIALVFAVIGTTPALAANYNLTLDKGSGAGSYAAGKLVYIHANPYDTNDLNRRVAEPREITGTVRIFSNWSGDVQYLKNIYDPDTTLVMPASNVTLTAVYKDVPRWGPPTVVPYLSPNGNPNGVIFLFHGGGDYCNATCLVSGSEVRQFIDDAASRGYGVVAVTGYDYRHAKWDENPDPYTNIDMQRVAAVRNDLIARKQMSATAPIYVAGYSGGGVFASRFTQNSAAAVGFKPSAAVLFISPGDYASLTSSTIPTIFVTAAKDPYVDATQQSFNALLAQRVPTQFWVLEPTPVYPDRFWGIDGLSAYDSRAIFTALKNAGFLDADNFLVVNPETDLSWTYAIPPEYEQYVQEIRVKLGLTYTEHVPFHNLDRMVFDFLAQPNTQVDSMPVIQSFSPAGAREGALVTISGHDFLGLSEVRFNGLSAPIQNANTTTIWVTVPIGATTGRITVKTAAGSVQSASDFQVYRLATMSGFSPTSGPVGTSVTITGTNMRQVTAVEFGTVPATFTAISDTQLIAVAPTGISTGSYIKLTTPAGKAVSSTYFKLTTTPAKATTN